MEEEGEEGGFREMAEGRRDEEVDENDKPWQKKKHVAIGRCTRSPPNPPFLSLRQIGGKFTPSRAVITINK